MSRIHEALKRAEQEKAASQSAQKAAERGEPIAKSNGKDSVAAPPVISTPVVVQTTVAVAPLKAQPAVDTLKFDTVWANCSRPRWKPDPNFLVFSNPNPFHPGTEQFRTLRSRLYRMRESQPLQTILITSAIPAEGKTLVAANVAHAMVRQQGCRVLLIDADLRSPRTHTLLGAPPTPGLADYLQNGNSELEVIQRGHEDGFCFIPAGNHVTHPSELISSDRMKKFLERVKTAFDWIIIDSPPALPVADSAVLGGLCDGVLFVVRANSTPSETSLKACKELKDTQILGVVLNTVEDNAEYGAYYSNVPYGPSAGTHSKK